MVISSVEGDIHTHNIHTHTQTRTHARTNTHAHTHTHRWESDIGLINTTKAAP